MAEEAGQAAGVPEHDRRVPVEVAVADGGDEAGHGPAGVGGVEHDALGARGQPDGGGGGLGQAAVAGPDLVGAQAQGPRVLPFGGDGRGEGGDRLGWRRDRPCVHAEDRLGSELGHQPGHGAARADRDDRGRLPLVARLGLQLGLQFAGGIGVGQGAVAVAAAEGDDRRVRAGRRELGRRLVGDGGQAGVVGVAGPPDARAEELVEQQVARGRFARAACGAGQHEGDRQAEPGAGRGGQPGVIRLGRPGGDEAVGAVAERRGQGAFELADLVAAAAEAGEVVPLEP